MYRTFLTISVIFLLPANCFFILAPGFSAIGFAEDGFHAGLFYDQFQLTLDSADDATEAVGPLFYNQQKDTERTWAIPPIFSHDPIHR